MNTFILLLSIIAFLLLIIGLIKPSIVIKRSENKTRKRVLKVYGILYIVLFVAFIMTIPDDISQTSGKNKVLEINNSYEEDYNEETNNDIEESSDIEENIDIEENNYIEEAIDEEENNKSDNNDITDILTDSEETLSDIEIKFTNAYISFNNSVGNEWGYLVEINGENINRNGSIVISGDESEAVINITVVEDEKVPDYGYGKIVIDLNDVQESYSTEVIVTENRGKYSGNQAGWIFEFEVNNI